MACFFSKQIFFVLQTIYDKYFEQFFGWFIYISLLTIHFCVIILIKLKLIITICVQEPEPGSDEKHSGQGGKLKYHCYICFLISASSRNYDRIEYDNVVYVSFPCTQTTVRNTFRILFIKPSKQGKMKKESCFDKPHRNIMYPTQFTSIILFVWSRSTENF